MMAIVSFIFYQIIFILNILSINFVYQDRLMQMNVVNHRLNLTYEDFINMGESLSYTTIGKYAIYEKIGEGGFGEVYKGCNQATQQEVAVKVINVAKIHQYTSERLKEITLRLVKSEDLLMRVCNSPNLVKCYDVYQNESLKLMMIQFCNGGSLQEYIQKKGRIPEKQAILIFKQILNGIAECHSHMIIHRDLKSENVLIHNGIFKIADFGFSKRLEIEDQEMIINNKRSKSPLRKQETKNDVQAGTVLGTITNMAPEVMTRKPYGLKADIWSAGVILFQMVFGNFPFESRDKKSLINEIEATTIFQARRIKFNDYLASVEISDFLKLILVIDHQKRIGWRELITHPIFNSKQQKALLPRTVIHDADLTAPLELQNSSLNLGENISYILKKLNINVVFQDSEKVVKKMGNKQLPHVNTEQTEIYSWMNENLVECLKIELIYEQIISKIEAYKMLDLDEREQIELMYLLTTRCFLSISPINEHMSKFNQKYNFIKPSYDIVKILYHKIHQLFQKYGQLLTKEEDKFLNKVSDFFKSKEELEKTDKFFNGIENYDFKKDQQLLFIQKKYIDELKSKLKGPEDVRERVRKYLSNYTSINKIQFKHLENTNFDSYIQRLL